MEYIDHADQARIPYSAEELRLTQLRFLTLKRQSFQDEHSQYLQHSDTKAPFLRKKDIRLKLMRDADKSYN